MEGISRAGVSNWVNLTPSHCLSLSQRNNGVIPALVSITLNVIYVVVFYVFFTKQKKLAQALLNDITKLGLPLRPCVNHKQKQ